jgi:hypothetical protein
MLEFLKFVRKKRRKICLEKCTVVLRAGQNVFFLCDRTGKSKWLGLIGRFKYRSSGVT